MAPSLLELAEAPPRYVRPPHPAVVEREGFLFLPLEVRRSLARGDAGDRALMMIGGAVLPEARRQGVYRSLVAARWRSAVARGTPALVTSANEQSAPILRGLGFEELGEIVVYEDRL